MRKLTEILFWIYSLFVGVVVGLHLGPYLDKGIMPEWVKDMIIIWVLWFLHIFNSEARKILNTLDSIDMKLEKNINKLRELNSQLTGYEILFKLKDWNKKPTK